MSPNYSFHRQCTFIAPASFSISRPCLPTPLSLSRRRIISPSRSPHASLYTSLIPSEEPHPNNPFSISSDSPADNHFPHTSSPLPNHSSVSSTNVSVPTTSSNSNDNGKHHSDHLSSSFNPTQESSNPPTSNFGFRTNDLPKANVLRDAALRDAARAAAAADAATARVVTADGQMHGADSDDNNDHDHDHERHAHDEIFFEGLSYPADALEWCTAFPDGPDVMDAQQNEANLSSSPYSEAATSQRICIGSHDVYSMRVEEAFVETFRMSSPYINAHQGLVFVIHIPGSLIGEKLFASVMEDIALMRVVGIKLVLVIGVQNMVNKRLAQEGVESKIIDGIRVTDARALQVVKELAGSVRFEVESALAKGVTNMPSNSRITVVSGSFYSAQPVGVIEGEDFGYTGKVRRVDSTSIHRRLDQGDIIIIPNIGTSPSGQQFNCKSEEVASECAAQLKAEKLIFMGSGETLFDKRSDHTIPNLTLKSAARFLEIRKKEIPHEFRMSLQCSVNALERGVRRAHILNRFMNGVLLMEVFHRDGVGLMVSRDLYEGFRRAQMKDVNGVKAIIKPLEDQGILKPRSKTTLESDIEKFVVIERDGMIIACMSLTQMEDDPTWAELGCVAVHRDYRKLGKGDAMLGFTERMAYGKGVRNLFVLSTQSFDWFHERGFQEVNVTSLPTSRQALYDRSRRSKIFYKVLEGSRAVSYLFFS